jgi:hypothetical protein
MVEHCLIRNIKCLLVAFYPSGAARGGTWTSGSSSSGYTDRKATSAGRGILSLSILICPLFASFVVAVPVLSHRL